MDEQDDISGFDLVWLALDMSGQLGAFVTAGVGPIPVKALGCTAIQIEDIETALLALPRIASAELQRSQPRPDSFVELAVRGLFVYDWTDIHRKRNDCIHAYELVAMPRGAKLELSSLPPKLREFAGRALLEDACFGAQAISVL